MTASTALTVIMVVFGACGVYAARKRWMLATAACVGVVAAGVVATAAHLAITLGWWSL